MNDAKDDEATCKKTANIADDYSVANTLLFNVNETPPVGILFSISMQNILLGLGGALTTAYVISDVICAAPEHPVRAKLFCTSLFITGICTILQPLFGIRLSIFQGACSTFLIPLMAMRSDSRWQCENLHRKESPRIVYNTTQKDNISLTETDDDEEMYMYFKLREIMGCLIYASLSEVIVGLTGLVGILLRFIGPLTISVVVSLIGLSLYKVPLIYIRTHWGMSAACILLTILFMLYMDRIGFPCPKFCAAIKRKRNRVPVFQMFPIASRTCMISTGVLCIVLSLVGKFGAVLSTMPDPAIGGAMFVTFGMIGAIGIFTLRSVDLTASRNLVIFGLSLYFGIVIPEWVERYPEAVNTGTLHEQGFTSRNHELGDTFYTVSENETYDLNFLRKAIETFLCLQKLPFIQSGEMK